MAFISYTFTQPYYVYQENWKYNVIPGTITLTFDTDASVTPSDYRVEATQGKLMYTVQIGFSYIDSTLSTSGVNATLTLPINMDSNAYIQVYYQGSKLNFLIRCSEDFSYETPAIFEGYSQQVS